MLAFCQVYVFNCWNIHSETWRLSEGWKCNLSKVEKYAFGPTLLSNRKIQHCWFYFRVADFRPFCIAHLLLVVNGEWPVNKSELAFLVMIFNVCSVPNNQYFFFACPVNEPEPHLNWNGWTLSEWGVSLNFIIKKGPIMAVCLSKSWSHESGYCVARYTIGNTRRYTNV